MQRWGLVILAALACSAQAYPVDSDRFNAWQGKHAKVYSSSEEREYRASIFAGVAVFVDNHNNGTHTYRLDTNHFADMTPDEISSSKGALPSRSLRRLQYTDVVAPEGPSGGRRTTVAPKAWDWTNVNGVTYLTGIKNQGSCGSCWAFATVAAIEGINAINNGQVVSLSEQQLVACVSGSSCSGGYSPSAMAYVVSAGGLCTETAYPYTSSSTGSGQPTCLMPGQCQTSVTISSSGTVPAKNDLALQSQVLQQPVVITLYAGDPTFTYYSSGVYTGPCSDSTDHNVIAYGFDVDPLTGLQYWKLKNQWGTFWGEGGYMRMLRNPVMNSGQGQCLMYTGSYYPIQ